MVKLREWKLIRDMINVRPELVVDAIEEAMRRVNEKHYEDFFRDEPFTDEERRRLSKLLIEKCGNVVSEEGVEMCILEALKDFGNFTGEAFEKFTTEYADTVEWIMSDIFLKELDNIIRDYYRSYFHELAKEILFE